MVRTKVVIGWEFSNLPSQEIGSRELHSNGDNGNTAVTGTMLYILP